MSKYNGYLNKLNGIVKSFEDECKNKLESSRHDYEATIQAHSKEKSNLIDEHNRKISSIENTLKKNYEDKIARLIQDYSQEKSKEISSLESTLKKKYEAEKSNLINEHNRKISSLESSTLKKKYEDEKSNLIDEHNRKISSLENNKKTLQTAYETAKLKLTNELSSLKNINETLKKDYETEKSTLIDEHNRKILSNENDIDALNKKNIINVFGLVIFIIIVGLVVLGKYNKLSSDCNSYKHQIENLKNDVKILENDLEKKCNKLSSMQETTPVPANILSIFRQLFK